MPTQHIASSKLPTAHGAFDIHAFQDEAGRDLLALTMGVLAGDEPALLRVHSGCTTGDALFSLRCDCGAQLEGAMQLIAGEGRGALIYLPPQEGRGIGLANKLRAYALQDEGLDTVEANERLGFPADARDYRACVPILAWLGLRHCRLLTNNPNKVQALSQYGVTVERVPLTVGRSPQNQRYLDAKAEKLGHQLG